MTKYRIVTLNSSIDFNGEHIKEKETNNWHYYKNEEGLISRYRKDKMVYVVEYGLEKITDGHKIEISTTVGNIEFVGKYLKQTKNWHYYGTDSGKVIHLRKEHMDYVNEFVK